jgi:hypothetical protein
MFLAACTELTGPEEDAFSGKTIAPGVGQAHIRLDKLNARTAIPGLDGLHFTLDFTATGKTSVNETLNKGLMTLTVALESGTWGLEVKGYSASNILTVRGESTITITAGISSNVVVYLTPDFSEGGTGTLKYSVSFPGTVISQAFLSLYRLDVPGTGLEIDILESTEETTVAETIELPAGSYQALIDLYDSTKNKAAVWAGVVHIYDGSTTSLEQTFTVDNFASPQVVATSKKNLADKLDVVLGYPTGSYTIALDETSIVPKTLKVEGDKALTITITGNGQTVSLDEDKIGSLLTLSADPGSSLTLILEDITLQGKEGNNAPVVQVNSGGTLELKADSVLTGNTSSGNGSGVVVAGGGTLNMSGGTISKNTASGSSAHGGGVYVASGGIFTMSDGEISGNSTPNSGSSGNHGGGGVYVEGGGTFIMTGGVVSGNTSGWDGGGVLVHGGKFEMSGGEISVNSAINGGGVYVYGSSGTFTMSGGVIYGEEAGEDKANTAQSCAVLFKYNGGYSALASTSSTIDKRTP